MTALFYIGIGFVLLIDVLFICAHAMYMFEKLNAGGRLDAADGFWLGLCIIGGIALACWAFGINPIAQLPAPNPSR